MRKVEASTHCENDLGTAKPWIPGASNSQSGLIAHIFDPENCWFLSPLAPTHPRHLNGF